MSRATRRRKAGGTRDGGTRDEGASADGIDATKTCPACGLPFSNRKKWAARGLWDSIVYCSERCRRAAAATRRRND